jgi:hypothetical protein
MIVHTCSHADEQSCNNVTKSIVIKAEGEAMTSKKEVDKTCQPLCSCQASKPQRMRLVP